MPFAQFFCGSSEVPHAGLQNARAFDKAARAGALRLQPDGTEEAAHAPEP